MRVIEKTIYQFDELTGAAMSRGGTGSVFFAFDHQSEGDFLSDRRGCTLGPRTPR